MSGVLLLSFSTVVVKIIGLAFKIPMMSYLGAEGMGYFNSAYEIYALLCVVATAGLPLALSMNISVARARRDMRGVKRAYGAAKLLFFAFGSLGSLTMLLLADRLAIFIGNEEARLCISASSPALFCVCIASAIRGYTQGFEYMAPTAFSQLIEALSKLVFGILFAALALRRGRELYEVAAFAVFGISVGCFLSLIYLLLAQGSGTMKRKRAELTLLPENLGGRNELKSLFVIALPITLGSLMMGLTRIADMTLIMRRLRDIGISAERANEIYGAYTTLAVPIFSLVPALIAPVSMALVPQLAAFVQRNDREGQKVVIDNSVKLTALAATPASIGLALFAHTILEIIFPSQSEAITLCAPLLSVLGGSVLFSCLISTTNAVLQANKRIYLPVLSMSAGLIVKIAATYFLLGVKQIGVMGAPIGSFACNATVTIINLCFMRVCTEGRVKISTFFYPLAASCISVGAAFVLHLYLQSFMDSVLISFGVSAVVAALGYIVLSFVFGSLNKRDISLLPCGDRLLAMLERIGKNKKEKIIDQ